MLKRFEDTAILPLQLFGGVEYYALLSAYSRVIINDLEPYDKRRKQTHRFDIADVRGKLSLTVPVAKPAGHHVTWGDIPISDHGQWWQDIDVSLASAYGRTPFYEFYIDRLRQFFCRETSSRFASVAELDIAADLAVRQILGITTEVIPASGLPHPASADSSVIKLVSGESGAVLPYYQVRADKLGFIPGLSILDLIFNVGTEAPLYIRRLQNIICKEDKRDTESKITSNTTKATDYESK